MKKFLFFSLIAAITLSPSCTKEYKTRVCDEPSTIDQFCDTIHSRVNVRTVNLTGYPLCNVRVTYNSNQEAPYAMGRMNPSDSSCFTKFDFVKVYPIVKFTLGTKEFQILDSLRDKEEYSSKFFNTPGFYNMFIQIEGLLDTGYVSTYIQKLPYTP